MRESAVLLSADDINRKSGRNSASTGVSAPASLFAAGEKRPLIHAQTPVLFGLAERFVLVATVSRMRSSGESVSEKAFSATTASSAVFNCCTLTPLRKRRH